MNISSGQTLNFLKFLTGIFLLVLPGLTVTADEPSSQLPKVLKVASDNWCPYACLSTDKHQGVFIDALKYVFEPDIKVSYKHSSWVRAIENVKKGQFHALPAAIDEQRRDFDFADNFYLLDESVFVVKTGSDIKIVDPADLNAYSLGSIKGYFYDDTGSWQNVIDEHKNHLQITSRLGEAHLLELLAKGRIQVAVVNRDVAQYSMAKQGLGKQLKLIRVGIGSKMYIAFARTPEGKATLDYFDKNISKLLNNESEVKALFERYGLDVPDHLSP